MTVSLRHTGSEWIAPTILGAGLTRLIVSTLTVSAAALIDKVAVLSINQTIAVIVQAVTQALCLLVMLV